MMFVALIPTASADEATNPIRVKHGHSDRGHKQADASRESQNVLDKEELAELKKAKGPSYKGESTDFNAYMNSDKQRVKDDDIRLVDLKDPNSKIVLGAEDAPAGVSFKMDFENSPLE